jgi:hypothetical protein
VLTRLKVQIGSKINFVVSNLEEVLENVNRNLVSNNSLQVVDQALKGREEGIREERQFLK